VGCIGADGMNRDDIIRMAREAGWKDLPTARLAFAGFDLKRFAALVAAAEREACAQVCETEGSVDDLPEHYAAACRARGKK
jgi:hypothetical protein